MHDFNIASANNHTVGNFVIMVLNRCNRPSSFSQDSKALNQSPSDNSHSSPRPYGFVSPSKSAKSSNLPITRQTSDSKSVVSLGRLSDSDDETSSEEDYSRSRVAAKLPDQSNEDVFTSISSKTLTFLVDQAELYLSKQQQLSKTNHSQDSTRNDIDSISVHSTPQHTEVNVS